MNALICAILLTFSQLAEAGVGCGKQTAMFQPAFPRSDRVVNGQYAQPHSWPWMIEQRWNNNHYCGGSLIRVSENVEASDIVLTAAHCVGTSNPINFNNWVAVANLQWQSYMVDAQIRNITNAKYPSNYTHFTQNDIALIKLSSPVQFSDTVRPICLPKQNEALPVGKFCVATGWGRIYKDSQQSSETLQQLESPVYDANKCYQMWGSQFNYNVALCAGPLDGSAAVCNGDSGGVLACRGDDGRWVQYGVVSYVVSGVCAFAGMPPVFSKVSTFVDWIQATARELTSIR